MNRTDDLARIATALDGATDVLSRFTPGAIEAAVKDGGDPVTAADMALDAALKDALLEADEGWLSEETADDLDRLTRNRVWVVDPLDGTREFVEGIPEWCVSVGLVEDGVPVAGGILAPGPGHAILGAEGLGVTLNRRPSSVSDTQSIAGALVLASRSEMKRGEWNRFLGESISIRNMGSVAYKLGLVSVGLADATWTLAPKHEWDVAAGVALVLASGGQVALPGGGRPRFNQPRPWYPGLIASNGHLMAELGELVGPA